MNGSSYLLDTNAAVARIAGDAAIQSLLERADAVFLTSIVLGELSYGAEKSERVEANPAEIAKFAAGRTILVCDAETARWYGRIKRQLQLKGRPIPQNDIWIAAVARQHNLTLVTRDEHFEQIEALPLKTW